MIIFDFCATVIVACYLQLFQSFCPPEEIRTDCALLEGRLACYWLINRGHREGLALYVITVRSTTTF